MITRLLKLLHQQPILSTTVLLVVGMAVVFANMLFLSNQMREQIAEQFAETYVRSLDGFQTAYTTSVVARVKDKVIVTHDYHERDGAIPIPATFSIELADALTDPSSGVITRVYSDLPFKLRTDGGPRDDFERFAMDTLRSAADPLIPVVRYEDVNGRRSLRYAKAIVMKDNCVACHNSHPQSPRTDWKSGEVRGVRAVTMPLADAATAARSGWFVTLAVMLSITLIGVGLVFVIVQALRTSIDMLSTTNVAYNRFVPHEFLGYLSKQSIVDVRLNDNIEKEMTVLFSDIRSFTSISEKMTPEENFRFVNEYLSVMGPVVRRNNGFIDKYIGDAIMALFDSPDDAVNASVEMLMELKDYNLKFEKPGTDALRVGIGVHTGKLRLGTIGERDRMDGTVIGDSVNLAARLEGLTKFYRVQVLISGATYSQLENKQNFTTRKIDKVIVKGKAEPVVIHEVLGAGETSLSDKKLVAQTRFDIALAHFQAREFSEARALFVEISSEIREDHAAAMFVDRCDAYLRDPPPQDWNGALQLDTK